MEDFDPRPVEFRGTANSNVKELLDKLAGKGLSISLSLDPQADAGMKAAVVLK